MPNHDKKKIVAIDDSTIITETIKTILSDDESFEVFAAENGEDGLQIIKDLDYKVDLIILDFHMPKMNGIEMLREIQNLKPDFPAPTVMLTTEMEQKTDEATQLGVINWVLKPLDEEKMKTMIPLIIQHYPVRY